MCALCLTAPCFSFAFRQSKSAFTVKHHCWLRQTWELLVGPGNYLVVDTATARGRQLTPTRGAQEEPTVHVAVELDARTPGQP